MARSDGSKFYIHCGFHKTGSTSLQAALIFSAARLRAMGVLVPYAGTTANAARSTIDPAGAGHHNIAWQLLRSRRFDHGRGNIADLAQEIAGFSGDVILSSEFFESLLGQPDALNPLRNLARDTGREVVFILYLRNQIAYCESLFFEMLKHGEGLEYARHTAMILQTGTYCQEESINHFHYDRVVDNLTRDNPGQQILLRNYQTLGSAGIVADFGDLLGLGDALQSPIGQEVVNRRESLSSAVYWFYRNRRGMRPTPIEKARILHVAQQVERPTTGGPTQNRFVAAFATGNRRLCDENGLANQGLTAETMSRPESSITLEQVFSFETQCAIATGRALAPKVHGTSVPADWLDGIDTAAKTISKTEVVLHHLQKVQRARRRYTDQLVNRLFDAPPSSIG